MTIINNNNTAILTGYNKGIGKSIAINLAKEGYNLILCSRKKNQEFVKELNENFKISISEYNFDLNDINQTVEVAKKITRDAEKIGMKINLLINNAGSIKTGLFMMDKIENFKEIFEINFFSQVFFTQAIIPALKKNDNSSIINISSTSALEHDMGRLSYNTSKAALISFSKSLSKELSMFKIRVNCIAPGLIETEMLRKNTSEKVIDEIKKKNISKRTGNVEEVSELVVFLASHKAKYINGQVIRLDGGMF